MKQDKYYDMKVVNVCANEAMLYAIVNKYGMMISVGLNVKKI